MAFRRRQAIDFIERFFDGLGERRSGKEHER
jgi:hypothetical protein